MFITGVMSPFIGCGIDVSFTVRKLVDDTPVNGFLSYQWYRVNPATYEMTVIPGATNLRYITTAADAGYILSIIATSDGVNVGGSCQLMVQSRNIYPNKVFLTNKTNTGFAINMYKNVSGFSAADFEIYDKDNNLISVTSVTQGQNAAIYNVTAALDVAKNPFIMRSKSPNWSMVTSMMEGGMHGDMFMEAVNIDLTTGLNAPTTNFSVYPSPAKNELNFVHNNIVSEAVILNMSGQTISKEFVNKMQGVLNTSELSNGFYLLKLISANGKTTLRKFQILK